MGQNFSSEPVIDKDTERDHNDTFNVAVSSCQGWRMSQEDNHSLILDLPGGHKAAFFAVYDGHGSARVSKHASEGLWRHLVENDLYLKGNYKEALESAFLTFDREVNESYNAQLAGTTAICVLIVENKIYCANIGDSRAVACVNCECVPLSYDHKPENPQELKRILAAGGYVLGNRVNGNLALSRAFGDFHYKGNEQLPAEQQIVSPCPDVKTIELNDDVDFLVLACDGIWDVLSSEEVVEFVINRIESDMELGRICEQLTTRCLATDYELVIGCDNMTVLIVCYTRGRSWFDYCTDVFNKNSRRLGEFGREKKLTTYEYDALDAFKLDTKPDNAVEQSATTEEPVTCESKKEEKVEEEEVELDTKTGDAVASENSTCPIIESASIHNQDVNEQGERENVDKEDVCKVEGTEEVNGESRDESQNDDNQCLIMNENRRQLEDEQTDATENNDEECRVVEETGEKDANASDEASTQVDEVVPTDSATITDNDNKVEEEEEVKS